MSVTSLRMALILLDGPAVSAGFGAREGWLFRSGIAMLASDWSIGTPSAEKLHAEQATALANAPGTALAAAAFASSISCFAQFR